MSFKSSILENAIYLNHDVSIEQNYRDIWAALKYLFTSAGYTQKADGGQYNPFATAHMRANSLINVQLQNPNAAMDGTTTTGTGYKSNSIVPTGGAPVRLYLDVGTNLGTFQALSSRIFTYTNVWDPKSYTIDGSNDGAYNPNNPDAATWTPILVASTHAALPDLTTSNTSFQNLDTSVGYRYYRFSFTNIQGAGTYIQIPEIELYPAASGSGTKLPILPITGPGAGTNTQTSNFQIWQLNDYGAANGAPGYLKIWLGSGAAAGAPQIWWQLGTATDGGGNFTGASQTTPISLAVGSATSSINTSRRIMFSGSNVNTNATLSEGRMHGCMFYDNPSSAFWWSLERSKNSDGTDDYNSPNAALYLTIGTYNNTYRVITMPYSGTVPTPETESTMVLNSNGTNSSIRGNKIAVAPNEPWLGTRQYPLLGSMALWAAEGGNNAETIISTNIYGATHNYFTLGSNVTSVSRGSNSQSRLALRYE